MLHPWKSFENNPDNPHAFNICKDNGTNTPEDNSDQRVTHNEILHRTTLLIHFC